MRVLFAAISLVAWGFVGIAFAQAPTDRDTAKALQVQGLKLLDQGDAAQALEKFTTAYALVPSPRVLFNLGRAHFELGHGAEAYECFDHFLAEAENVPPKSRADAELMRSQLRTSVALIEVAGPDGAAVSIDGHERGRLPLERPLAVVPGTRSIVVRKDDKIVSEKRLRLVEATTTRLVVEIAPVAPPPSAPALPIVKPASIVEDHGPANAGLLVTPAPPQAARASDNPSPSILTRWWFWAAATAVVAAGAIGFAAATGRLSADACPSGRTCM